MQPISILLCALGGEGGSVLADWLVKVARNEGHAAQATSIPGVAQRTGATTYYLEISPQIIKGQRPVLGLNPLPGRLDALVSSELLETARQIGLGMASQDRTLIISHQGRTLTTAEKMVMGDGRADPQALLALLARHSRAHHVLDMAALTREAGTVVSAVMLGCIAASPLLPFTRAAYEEALSGASASAKASLRGFDLGYEAVTRQLEPQRYLATVLSDMPGLSHEAVQDKHQDSHQDWPVRPLPESVAQQFPADVHEMLTLGHARLLDYQGPAYARLYMDRLQRVRQAEDPQAAQERHPVLNEVARWLALLMAYEDIVRVADLKSRQARLQRVRAETQAKPGDLLKIYDHFKPGVPEVAGLLPQRFAQALLRHERSRTARGLPPRAWPIRVPSHTVWGLLVLRGLAVMRVLRPWSSRYAEQQSLIETWLQAVISATQRSPALGLEVAQCARLVKGYGVTHDRGRSNLLHILKQLRADTSDQQAVLAMTEKISAWREAALKDEAGCELDRSLLQHGATARPVPEQPILWHKNPRLSKASKAGV